MEADFIMWKRTKIDSKNNTKTLETREKIELSDTAIKAMYGEMTAKCMSMGATYGIYMPIMPLWYGDIHK